MKLIEHARFALLNINVLKSGSLQSKLVQQVLDTDHNPDLGNIKIIKFHYNNVKRRPFFEGWFMQLPIVSLRSGDPALLTYNFSEAVSMRSERKFPLLTQAATNGIQGQLVTFKSDELVLFVIGRFWTFTLLSIADRQYRSSLWDSVFEGSGIAKLFRRNLRLGFGARLFFVSPVSWGPLEGSGVIPRSKIAPSSAWGYRDNWISIALGAGRVRATGSALR